MILQLRERSHLQPNKYGRFLQNINQRDVVASINLEVDNVLGVKHQQRTFSFTPGEGEF